MDDAADLIRAIAALAWPVVAVVVVLLFRSEIAARIQTARRVKAGPFEAEWDSRSAEVQAQVEPPQTYHLITPDQVRLPEDLYGLARQAPASAIVGACAVVERALRDLLPPDAQPDEAGVPMTTVQLARVGHERGLINEETRRAIEGITVMKNLAAHGAQQVTEAQARDYLKLVEGVLYAIANPSPRASAPPPQGG